MKPMFRTFAAAVVAAGMISAPAFMHAQENIHPTTPQANTSKETAPSSYTKEQLVTATVHQAWLISGKDQDKFFDMVQELAQMSAMNRGITLPDNEAAGKRMGNYIKAQSKMDTDQLLYAVVDKAVVMIAHAPTRPAAHRKS